MAIGSLEIQIMADLVRLQKDMEAAKGLVAKGMDGVAKAAKVASGAFAALGVGLSVGAFTGWVKGAVDAADAANKLSQKTGMAVEDIAGMQLAYQQAGVDSDKFQASQTKLSLAIAEGNRGLDALGIKTKDATGAFRSNKEVMYELADRFASMENGAQKTALAVEIFKKSGADMIPMLNGGAQSLREFDEMAAKLGLTISAKTASEAEKFNDTLELVELGGQGIARGLAAELLPTLSALAGSFLTSMTQGDRLKNTAEVLGTGLRVLYSVALGVAEVFNTVGKAIGAVGATITNALFGDIDALNKLIHGDFSGAWEAMKKTVITSKDIMVSAGSDIAAGWESTGQAISGAWKKEGNAALDAQVAAKKRQTDLLAEQKAREEAAAKAAAAAEAAAKKEVEAYAGLISAIRAKTSENRSELASDQALTDSQKTRAKLDVELATGKLKLTAAHVQAARAALDEQAASERLLATRKTEREVTKYLTESAAARDESNAQLALEYKMYGQSSDAREIAMIAIREQTNLEKFLRQEKEAGREVSQGQIVQLTAEAAARVKVEQATLAQSKALGYTAQLAAENRRFAAESIADEKARAAALLEIDAEVWRTRISDAGAGTKAQQDLQVQYNTWYANQAIKPQLDAQKKMWDSIEQTAHDTFVSIMNGGKDAFSRLKDTIKNTFFDWLYQMTLKRWIVNIGASITGTVPGMAQASGTSIIGTAGNALSLGQIGTSIYGAIANGFSGISTAVADAVQTGMYSTGMSENLLVNGPVAEAAGAAAAYAVGAAVGVYGGRALSNGYSAFGSGSGNSAVNAGTVIGAILGGPIGAAIGGLIGGATNRLFGMREKVYGDRGIVGDVDQNSTSGVTFAEWSQKGGVFRSDKADTDFGDLGPELSKALVDGFKAVRASAVDAAASLGLGAEALDGYKKAFDITFTADAKENEAKIAAMFVDMGNEVASKLIPNIAQFALAGEAAATTLQRLVAGSKAVETFVGLIGSDVGKAFGAAGIAAVEAKQRVIDLAGGIDAFAQQSQFYAQNFLSEAERMAPVVSAVGKALDSLGLSGLKTIDDFKGAVNKLVSSGEVATEAGAKQFSALMALAPAFKQVADYTAGLTGSLSDLGEAAKSAGATGAEMLSSLKDSAAGAFDNLSRTIDAQIDLATQVHDDTLRDIAARRTLAESSYAAARTIRDASLKAATDQNARIANIARTLQSALDGMRMPGDTAAAGAGARQEIAQALSTAKLTGVLPGAEKLGSLVQAASQISEEQFASYEDYAREFYRTQNDLAELSAIADQQLKASDASVRFQEAQLDLLERNYRVQISAFEEEVRAADEAYKRSVEQFEAMRDLAQKQLDAANGEKTALDNLGDAFRAFKVTIGSVASVVGTGSAVGAVSGGASASLPGGGGRPGASGTSSGGAGGGAGVGQSVNLSGTVEEAIVRSWYARNTQLIAHPDGLPDLPGLQFWTEALRHAPLEDVKRGFAEGAAREAGVDTPLPISAFELGGDHRGGWRLVGERGPELEATGPSRIFNANQTASILSGAGGSDALVAELREQKQQNAELGARLYNALVVIAKNTGTQAELMDTWDLNGMPKERTEA